MARIKQGHLAGTWYAGTAALLRRQVDELLGQAGEPWRGGPLAGIVVPHAGYQYSGATAALAFRSVAGGGYRRVVLLAPSHYLRYRGAAVLDVDAFLTPLGEVMVDRAALDAIAEDPLVCADHRPFEQEHSLEIQLPLLQRVLPETAVVPLLLSDLSVEEARRFAGLLRRLAGPRSLFVVSSDFTHYGERFDYLPFPPSGPDSVRAHLRQLDMGAIERVLAGDLLGFRHYVAETGATICGQMPIAAFLAWAADGAVLPGTLLGYTTSLDLTGDFEHSVSYAALAFARPSV